MLEHAIIDIFYENSFTVCSNKHIKYLSNIKLTEQNIKYIYFMLSSGVQVPVG